MREGYLAQLLLKRERANVLVKGRSVDVGVVLRTNGRLSEENDRLHESLKTARILNSTTAEVVSSFFQELRLIENPSPALTVAMGKAKAKLGQLGIQVF